LKDTDSLGDGLDPKSTSTKFIIQILESNYTNEVEIKEDEK